MYAAECRDGCSSPLGGYPLYKSSVMKVASTLMSPFSTACARQAGLDFLSHPDALGSQSGLVLGAT